MDGIPKGEFSPWTEEFRPWNYFCLGINAFGLEKSANGRKSSVRAEAMDGILPSMGGINSVRTELIRSGLN